MNNNKENSNATALIKKIIDLGINISIKNNNLDISAKKGVITKEILSEITFFKVELTDYLLKQISKGKRKKHLKITPVDIQESYVLSSAQRRLWILSQFEGGNLAYNIPGVYEFEGDLDIPSFQKSFDTLIERHEILRTVFKKDASGEVRQWIKTAEEQGFKIDYQDLRKVKSQKSRVKALVQTATEKVFDLEQGPLLIAQLLQIGKDKYIFTYVMHHIISDGWSMGVMIKELLTLYNSYSQGKDSPLEELSIQYKDYSAWQLSQLEDENGQGHKDYWLNQFSGELPVLELPTDHLRPALKTYNGGRISGVFSEHISSQLQQFIKQEDSITLFMCLLSLVKTLLYRYTNQEDIILGTPIAGREHTDLVDQIGFYVNTLALRTQFDGDDSFKTLLQKVKATTLSAYEHQIYPFDELIEHLDLRRDLSRSPLFDVLVVLQNNDTTSKEAKLGELQISPYKASDSLISKFDLSFNFIETDQGLHYSINYNTDLFEKGTIKRLENHLNQLLSSIVASPEKSISQLDYLSKKEAQQLLVGFNDTNAEYPKDKTIIELFEDQVSKTPNNIAVVFEEKELTYQELNECANQLGDYLRSNYKIQADDLITIKLDRSQWLLIAILGVLKSGGAYVPIDPEYPEDRINFMLSDSNCKALIDKKEINKFKKKQKTYSKNNLPILTSSKDLAYVIYTSGSTGKPKGAMIEHKSLLNYIMNQISEFEISEDDNILQYSNISFDPSIEQIFIGLLKGARLTFIQNDVAKDYFELSNLIVKNKITHFHSTPSYLSQGDGLESKYLKRVVSGGEVYLNTIVDKYKGDIKFYNKYGPSEATITSIQTEVLTSNTNNGLIGKPINNVEIYILSNQENLLPIGVVGEICISGEGLARGYLNRPELTAKKFVTNPFKDGERMYKTGDLGRWLPDGNIEFLGRKDDQVKIRGYRIELGEIENVLQQHPAIEQTVVIVKEAPNQEQELVAYLTSKEELTTSGLRSFLKKRLPDYMLPSHFVSLEELPLTPNGKVDKKALPSPESFGLASGVEYIAPSTETEKELVKIWSEILKVEKEKIGLKDDFFDLGGHSLRATTLASKIYQRLEVNISLKSLFENTTIEEQASFISKEDKTTYYHIEKVASQESYVLSSAQRRLWILSQFEGGNLAYNMPGVYEFAGYLDIPAFQKAFSTLVVRHEILRTVFKKDESGEIRQWVKTTEEQVIEVDYQDLRKINNQESRVKDLVQKVIEKSFDLEHGPLLRAQLLQTAKDKYVFIYVMHHIISDGWSMGVLIKELTTLYNNYSQGKDSPLESLALQYKDYSAWQLAQLKDENGQQHKAYWLNLFSGDLPVLELPTDHTRPALKTYNGGCISGVFSESVSRQLIHIFKQENSTVFMGLLSLIKTLLYKYTGQSDIIIGSPIAGRSHADLAGQIGCYVNTLALRTQFDGADSFKRLLQKVKQTTLSAYEHQIYSFDELIEHLNLRRDLSRSSLFDVMVDLQSNEMASEDEKLGELQISAYEESEWLTSKFDLEFSFKETDQGLDYSINYNTDLFEKETIERFEDHLKHLTESIVESPEKPINKLDYLSKKEEQQLLLDFNDTKAAYPKDKTIVNLFEEQVAKTPNNIAVVFEKKEFTYQEINERANLLGDYLRSNYEIQADDLIGICLDRSEWMIIAILGVLKSGGAYVPIDLEYPQERIDFILKDSNCKAFIDQKELDEFRKTEEKYSKENLRIPSAPNSLAYVIYTSGTTGKPKGVMIENESLANALYFWKDKYALGSSEVRLLQLASFSFDVSVADICRSILFGGTMVISSKNNLLNFKSFYNLVNKNRISIIEGTPSFLILFIDYIRINRFKISDLKFLIFGGDTFKTSNYEMIKQTLPGVKIINSYGLTEVTIDSTYFYESKIDSESDKYVQIGKPINNTQIYILGNEEKLLPIGALGEICISGAGLARGYLNRPELTNKKFVPNPFKEGERMYKTGDLGRWLADGNIEFVGRKDDQVKIRGYRIELGEIENTLLNYPAITQTVVLLKEDANQEKQFVAYLTSQEELTTSDLRAYLKKRLPDYMLPSHFVLLEAFPLTPNGKLDKKSLPSPKGLGLATGVEYIAPSNKIEKELVKIWSEVLKIEEEKIGVKDDFFDLGGHSLRATTLASKIYQRLEVNVPLKNLFENTSIKEQSLFILKEEKTSYYQIAKVAVQESYALSSAQRRLWILSKFEGGNLAYNMSEAYKFEGDLNISSFQKALDTLIERHEILRTVFKEDALGEVRQCVKTAEEQGFEIDYQDLRKIKNQKSRVKDLVQSTIKKAFDLEQGPLLRAQLLQTAKDKYIFIYVMHHIISDGWSMELLIKELLILYNNYSQGKPNPLEALPIQYKDYSAWQLSQLEDEKGQRHKAYWLKQFSGELPVLELPTDHLRPALKTYNGSYVSGAFSDHISSQLQQFIKQEDSTTLYMGLLSLVKTLLYCYTGQGDIIVGSPIAGREHADLDEQIGFYINTLALRTQFEGADSFRELLQKVKATTLSAYEHQIYPFDELVEHLDLSRDLSKSPLFDVIVVLQNTDITLEDEKLGELQVSSYEESEFLASHFDLKFNFVEIDQRLHYSIIYNMDIFESSTIERLANHLKQLTESIVASPEKPINKLNYLSKGETQQLLVDFNDTRIVYPQDETIVHLFEDQVVKTPNNIALVFEEKEFTYQELNERANQLGDYLRSTYKIQSDDLVAINLDRSEWMIISILGVLKSGGAYVPIDPEYPKKRISFMLEDSQPKAVIDKETINQFKETREKYQKENLPIITSSNDLIYVIYTSGSTGKSKGVLITHGAVLDYTFGLCNEVNFKDCHSFGWFSTVAADLGNTVVFSSLILGKKLIVLSENELNTPSLIHKKDIDVIKIVPSHWKIFQTDDITYLPNKCILFGGEKLTEDIITQIKKANYEGLVYNHYGPTETTIGKLLKKINHKKNETISLGSTFGNNQVYVLNEEQNLVSIGVIGEICISGSGLARGYLNRPELTAEKFVSNSFKEGAKMYKTGDLGRWLPDGNIEFIGRKDDQIKVRGYRIELGEIESGLLQHPEISQAMVLVKEDKNQEQQLVAYLTSKQKLTTADLRAYLKETLPDYMLPSHFVPLEVFPLTLNGKVDRKALPSPEGLGLVSGLTYVAPSTEIEKELVKIWSEVLKIEKEKIGVKDDFFDLGGHSLKIFIMLNKIHKTFNVKLDVKKLYKHPNIENIGNEIEIIKFILKKHENSSDKEKITL